MNNEIWQKVDYAAQVPLWNAAANTAQGKSVLGTKSKISGANLFMRLNYWVVYCGGQIMTAVPNLSGVEAPAAVTTAIDIKAKYDAKCGAPSAGSPKVFFRYFYVNTATGEKSGDVLAQAKLTSE